VGQSERNVLRNDGAVPASGGGSVCSKDGRSLYVLTKL
jgi:hypothetical protein